MKLLFQSNLELALEPISVENLNKHKSDSELHRVLQDSSLYLITKRPVLFFSNLEKIKNTITFKIVQPLTRKEIYCTLPIYQEEVINDENLEIEVGYNSDRSQHQDIYFFTCKKGEQKVIKWFTPDTILTLFLSEKIDCKISGDVRAFTIYEVKYVGEAVIQNIWKRLAKHENLQRILTEESSDTQSVKLSEELMVLFFRVSDTYDYRGGHETLNLDYQERIKNSPKTANIYYDAEKALINVLGSGLFNKRVYKNYPQSKDGLINESFDSWSYSIIDRITLKYKGGTIEGGNDTILISKKNKPVVLKNWKMQHNT